MKWQWSEDELRAHWFLSTDERALLVKKTKQGRLGFAVLLKFFQSQGCFPEQRRAIPDVIVDYLAHQVGVTPASLDKSYYQGSVFLTVYQRSCKIAPMDQIFSAQ